MPPEFIKQAESAFGLGFLSTPLIHRLGSDELRDRIAAAIESRFGPGGIDDRQMAYTLIGWLRPGEDLLTNLTIASSVDADAWLDDQTGQGYMLEKSNLQNIPDQAALMELLAGMLFHQHFPPPAEFPGDDADRARAALRQGTSAGAKGRFLVEKARSMGFMSMRENKVSEQLLASLSPFVRDLTDFNAIHGKGFADSLYVKGNEALHGAFRNPSLTTSAILRPVENDSLPAALDLPTTPEPSFLTESAGHLGLFLWLKPLGDVEAAKEISNSWKCDRYMLFPDGEKATALLWDIELASSASIDRLCGMADKLTGRLDSKTDEKRHVSIVRISPTKVRFLNTAQAGTAAKFKVE